MCISRERINHPFGLKIAQLFNRIAGARGNLHNVKRSFGHQNISNSWKWLVASQEFIASRDVQSLAQCRSSTLESFCFLAREFRDDRSSKK
jgi:hypothetical protein